MADWTERGGGAISRQRRLSVYHDLLQCRSMPTQEVDRGEPHPYRIYTPASVGAAIRHYRTAAGLTQAELAELTGIQRTYLSELESGKETAQLKRIFRILHRLGVRMTLEEADW